MNFHMTVAEAYMKTFCNGLTKNIKILAEGASIAFIMKKKSIFRNMAKAIFLVTLYKFKNNIAIYSLKHNQKYKMSEKTNKIIVHINEKKNVTFCNNNTS